MNNKELSDILNKIDNKDINDFLLTLLEYNENILNDFRSRFVNYFPKVSKIEYKNKVMNAIINAGGKDGYIDYSETWAYSHAMDDFIRESKNLLENKDYESSFDIIEVILDSIPDTDIDDSNGSTGEVANDCIEVIEDILGYCIIDDDNMSIRILNYLLNEIQTRNLYNYGIELYPLLDYFIDEKKYLAEIKDTLNKFLETHDEDKYKWERNKYIDILEKIKAQED